MEDDAEFLKELFMIFLKDAPVKIKELEIALNNNDSEKARMLAHSLGNITGTINAGNAYELVKKIEHYLKDNNSEKAVSIYNEFAEEINLVIDILEKKVNQ